MLHHPPASRSRGSARTFVLLAALLAGGVGAWWFARGGTSAPLSNPSLRSGAQAPGAREAVDVELTLPEATIGEPEARAAVESEPLTPVAFDVDRPLRGTLPPDVVLPRGESLEVVVEVIPPSEDVDADTAAAFTEMWRGSLSWTEVARIRPSANGRFEAPRPGEVSLVRIRPVGLYVIGGEVRYTPGGDDEPGDETFELPLSFGGRVTLQLRFDGDATPDEIEALEGGVLEFHSFGSADARVMTGRPMTCSVAIGASATAQIDSAYPYAWEYAGAHRGRSNDPLGPFLFPSGFHFEPRVGEHIVVEVPMERGTHFEGRVVDTTGAGLRGARISVTMIERTGGSRRTSAQQASTETDGRFAFLALRPPVDGIAVTARGYLDLSIGPVEAEALVAAGQPATLTLERGGELNVHAKLADGRVAAGVYISAQARGADEAIRARTDAEGRAKFIGLSPGPIELSSAARELRPNGPNASRMLLDVRQGPFGEVEGVDAETATLWALAHEVTEEEAHTSETIEVVFQRAPTVRGRIEGVDPAWPGPLALSIQRDDQSVPRFTIAGRGTSSLPVDQTTGEFAGQLTSGAYIAFAASGQRQSGIVTADSPTIRQTAEVQFEVANDDVELVLRFASGSSPFGVVRLDAGGPPLPMADVVLSRRELHFYMQCGITRTDDNGAFRFEAQPPGEYMLRVMSTRHVVTKAPVLTIEEGLPVPGTELVVQEGGAVRISVLDSEGRSIESPRRSVFRPDGSPTYTRPIEESGDWGGALGPLSPGTYVARHTQSMMGAPHRIHRAEFTVRAGEVSDVTLRETESSMATLTGTVTSQAGPVEGIRVWCSDALGTAGEMRTDASGAYRMDLMTTGRAAVRVGDSSARPLEEVDIVVVEGPNALPPISVPSGAIEGSMSESHAPSMGSMPAAFRVGAAPDEPPAGRAISMMNGEFTIPYLADGEYIVRTVAIRGEANDRAIPVRVTIQNGEVVRGVKIEFEDDER